MKRRLIIRAALTAVIVAQLIIGILSIYTLELARAIAMFGSAGFIYLGMAIVDHLESIRKLLSGVVIKPPPPLKSVQTYLEEKQNSKERPPRKDGYEKNAQKLPFQN